MQIFAPLSCLVPGRLSRGSDVSGGPAAFCRRVAELELSPAPATLPKDGGFLPLGDGEGGGVVLALEAEPKEEFYMSLRKFGSRLKRC